MFTGFIFTRFMEIYVKCNSDYNSLIQESEFFFIWLLNDNVWTISFNFVTVDFQQKL